MEQNSEREKIALKSKLLPHQEVAVARMMKKKNYICVEKTGRGKSIMALAAWISLFNREKLDTLMILSPKNAFDKGVWRDEVKKHTTCSPIDIETLYSKTGGNPNKVAIFIKKYPIIVCKHSHVYNFDGLMRMIQSLTRCAVLWDEIHKLKNPQSKLTIANRIMSSKAYCRYGLTATPLSKDMKDCYNIINFIKPWYLGTFDMFKKDYCTVTEKVIGRNIGGGLKKVEEITGVISEQALKEKLRPIVITGESTFDLNWHYVDYQMGVEEASIYRRLASGLFAPIDDEETAEQWFKRVMQQEVTEQYQVKEVTRHSSRFLYLQFAADGIIEQNGDIGNTYGVKCKKALSLLKEISEKGQSAIMYFDYYASLELMEKLIRKSGLNMKIIKTTGKDAIKDGMISEAKVKTQPYLIMSTKAGSESSSFYYINNVILFHIPTVPETFTQIVGRITRVNTIFDRDDLHAWIFRSENIDLYKLGVVCHKAALAEVVVNEEKNIPDEYKEKFKEADVLQLCKKYLLWEQRKANRVSTSLID